MELNTKSNKELLQILKEGSRVHSEQTIMDVEVILQERDVQYFIPYKKEIHRTENRERSQPIVSEKQNFIVSPALSAVILLFAPWIISMFYSLPRSANPEHLFYMSIGFIIFKRIIVLSLIDYYNKKLNISGILWYVLGIVFGSWTLIAYNIYLWTLPSRKIDSEILDSELEIEE